MNPHLRRLSHCGLRTSNLERSVRWYTEGFGLEEPFRLTRDGKPWIVYLHVTENTFVELFAPSAPGEPVPHGHLSLEVDDVAAAAEYLRSRLPTESIRGQNIITGADGSLIFNVYDPDGHRIELQQFPPESRQAQAMRTFFVRIMERNPRTGLRGRPDG